MQTTTVNTIAQSYSNLANKNNNKIETKNNTETILQRSHLQLRYKLTTK